MSGIIPRHTNPGFRASGHLRWGQPSSAHGGRSVRREGWSYKTNSVLLRKFLPERRELVGKLACGAKVIFHGSGGLVHDDEPRCAFAGLYKGVRHVARDEERVSCLDAHNLVSCLDFELALADKEPLIDVDVVMERRAYLFGAQSIKDHRAAFVVFAGDHHVKGCVEELEGLVVAVFACFDQDFLPACFSNLRES